MSEHCEHCGAQIRLMNGNWVRLEDSSTECTSPPHSPAAPPTGEGYQRAINNIEAADIHAQHAGEGCDQNGPCKKCGSSDPKHDHSHSIPRIVIAPVAGKVEEVDVENIVKIAMKPQTAEEVTHQIAQHIWIHYRPSKEEIEADQLAIVAILRPYFTSQPPTLRETELLLKLIAADEMARVADDWVERGQISSRSALADARLNYGKPYTYEFAKDKGAAPVTPVSQPPADINARISSIIDDPARKVEYGTPEYFLIQRLRTALAAPVTPVSQSPTEIGRLYCDLMAAISHLLGLIEAKGLEGWQIGFAKQVVKNVETQYFGYPLAPVSGNGTEPDNLTFAKKTTGEFYSDLAAQPAPKGTDK